MTARVRAIRICGQFDDTSGYAKLRRELALALDELGIHVQLSSGDAPLTPGPATQRVRHLMRPVDARYVIHMDAPYRITIDPDAVNILYSQIEADRIPSSWIEASLRCELVIVSCQASADAWAASGMPRDRLRTCPQGVRAERFSDPSPDPKLLDMGIRGAPLRDYATRFLHVADVWSGFRENPGGLIGAWLAATTEDDDAVLMLKWFDYRGDAFVQAFLTRILSNVEDVIGKKALRAAPIRLLTRWFPEEELASMYAAFTHYISVSCGEGWDLAMTEAGAAGLRLIAPDHTGYRAYLNASIATLLPASLIPANADGWDPWAQTVFSGARWWQTDLDAAATAIRDAIAGNDRYKPLARQSILRDFTWAAAAAQLMRILEQHEILRSTC